MQMRSPSNILESLVREELTRILASPEFSNSPYVRDFLRFIVESTLEGNSAHLKESVIGVHVFGRSIGYDPKLDPAVRMGAQRLRRKLEAYYATYPTQTLRIVLPKGSYVPQFVPVESPVEDLDAITDHVPELDEADLPSDAGQPPVTRRRRGWIIAAVVAGCLLAVYPIARLITLFTSRDAKADYNRITPFTSLPFDEYDATFSPDGSEVVYSWSGPKEENIDLYIQRIDEASPHRLTTDPGRDEFATWSPDGRWIAFRRNLREVMIVSPLGGHERRLGTGDSEYLSWVPDGSAVIVPKQRTGSDQYDLETITLATGERHTMTLAGQSVSGFEPFRFSPDGRHFAYCARPEPGSENEIYMRGAQGGPAIQITHTHRVIQGWTWTPDSREIIFSSNINGPFALWRVQAQPGAKPELVSGTGEDAFYPVMATYAPSRLEKPSSLLLYERWQRVLNMEERDIIIDHNSGQRRVGPPQPVFPSTRDDNSPQISPDGREVVFISNRSGFDELWKGDLAQLQEPMVLTSLGPTGLYPHFPRWSPDGRAIVFSVTAANLITVPGFDISDIYVISADGSGRVRRLTAWKKDQTHPSWSHDGRWIYFASNRTGTFQLWKLPADAPAAINKEDNLAAAIQLTHHGGTEGLESLDGQTFYFRNDDWDTGPIWAQASNADLGSAKPIFDPQTSEWWSVARDGIFYVDTTKSTFEAFPASASKPIFFFDPRTHRSTKVGDIRERFFGFRPDFCVSPDGRKIVYTQFVIKNIDLMLVRNFH
jgi:Tol biopolymer transport system component